MQTRVALLIPSGSYRARDFLAAARALDVEAVVGSDHRQVLAPCSGANGLYVDFADVCRGAEQVRAFGTRTPLDAVLATDDESALTAALAARALGLRHNDPAAVLAARDKYRFRRALHAAGLPGPAFCLVDRRTDLARTAQTLRYPCVVKPRSLSAGRGVIRADEPASFIEACARAGTILENTSTLARSDHRHTLLVEAYLPGREVALEGLLCDGRLEVLATMDKPAPMAGPFFEETLLVSPSRLPEHQQRAAADAMQRAAAALGLRHGPVHGELKIGATGPVMLELAPRSIGGLCSRALRFDDGRSLEAVVIGNALGMATPSPPARCGASGVMMIPIPRRGRLDGVTGVAQARAVAGVEDVIISVAAGDEVVPLPEGDRYLGFIFAIAATPAAVEDALLSAHAELAFHIV